MENKLTSIFLFFFYLIISINSRKYRTFGENDPSTSDQSLLIDIDIYNRPYVLPYFLHQLEQLTCPCTRCYLDLRIYHVFNTTSENETSRLIN
jgi:hypothetical protein